MASIYDLDTIVPRAVRTGINLRLIGEPAIGKTRKIEEVAAKLLARGDIDVFSQMNGAAITPIDTTATAPVIEEGILRRFVDGSLPNHYKTPDCRGIVYIGEAEMIQPTAQAPLQKVVNHEDFGDHLFPAKLPAKVVIITDGNLGTDRGGVQERLRPFVSRFRTIVLEQDKVRDVEWAKSNFHWKIGAFLQDHPEYINNYAEVTDPELDETDRRRWELKNGIWSSKRHWERLSLTLHDADTTGIAPLPEEMNDIGEARAQAFRVWLNNVEQLVTLEQIVKDPVNAAIPDDRAAKFTLMYMLLFAATAKRFPAIATYLRRLHPEIQTVFLQMFNDRYLPKRKGDVVSDDVKAIMQGKAYREWTSEKHIVALMLNQFASR